MKILADKPLCISLALFALALISPMAQGVDAVTIQTTIPAVYSDLYNQLTGDLDDFQSAIAAASTGAKSPTSFAAQLTFANSNNGLSLLNSSTMTLVQQELDFLKTMGVQAVSVEVSFPMLNATFLGSSYSQWVTFYGNVAAAVRARGLKLIVESQSMMPSGLQSSAWGTQLQTFYPTMNFDQYVAARAVTAAAVASAMKPDYFVLQEEPDTESVQSGQSSVGTASGATTLLNASLAAVVGLVPGMKVGAGFGPWLGAYQQFANSFTRTGCSASQPCINTRLDFLDMHLYPVLEHAAGCSRTAPCPPGTENFWRNAMSVVATANAAGMPTTISQAWLRKVRDSEWPPLGGAGDIQEAREAYDFWAPLDQRFLHALRDLAASQGMYWIAPFNTPNFSAYLQWSDANSISGDCGNGPSPCGALTPTQVYTNVQSAARTALPSGAYTSTGQYWHDLIASSSITPALPNYSDSWWNANESGWGITITDHGSNAFVQWYTYDQSKHNQKYVIAGGTFSNDKCQFSGTITHVTGPSWTLPVFDPNQVSRTTAGSGTLNFCPTALPAGTIVFNYTADGVTGSKQLTRLSFGNDVPHWAGLTNTGASDFTDLWWNSAESGWGVSVTQHGNNLFFRIFVYDTNGLPLLFVVPGVTLNSATSFSGTLQTTTGPWFGSNPFDPGQVIRSTVGTATLTFSDANNGVLSYTVNGVTKTKAITRMIF